MQIFGFRKIYLQFSALTRHVAQVLTFNPLHRPAGANSRCTISIFTQTLTLVLN